MTLLPFANTFPTSVITSVAAAAVKVFTVSNTLGSAIDLTTNGSGTNSIKNALMFTLQYGEPAPAPQPFSTVTQADLEANPYKNLFAVGKEYLQAATVVFNGSQSYTISDFYRGRFGTGSLALTPHEASEQVIFLDGSEQLVEIDGSRLNIPYPYKAVTTNQDVSDAPVTWFTWTGGTFRSSAPSNISIYRDSYSTSDSTRARLLQVSIPTRPHEFGEEVHYSVDIFNTVGITMTADTSTNELIHGAGDILVNGDYVAFSTTGVLPSPLRKEKHYYVRDKTSTRFKVAAFVGGPAIDLTAAGSGTNSFNPRLRHMRVLAGTAQPGVLDDFVNTVITPGTSPVLERVQSDYFGRNVADPTMTSQSFIPSEVDGTLVLGPHKKFRMLGPFTETGGYLEFRLDPITYNTNTFTRVSLYHSDGTPHYQVLFALFTGLSFAETDARRWKLSIKEYDPALGHTVVVYEDGGWELPGTEYRIEMVGSEARFIRNNFGLMYRSTRPLSFPLTPDFRVAPFHAISNIFAGLRTESITTYPDWDMIDDFDVTPPPTSFRIRAYESRHFPTITATLDGEVADFIA